MARCSCGARSAPATGPTASSSSNRAPDPLSPWERAFCAAARTVPGVATAAGRVSGGSAQIFVTGHREDLAPLVDAALAPVVTSLGLDLTVKVRQRPFVDEEERR